MVSQSALWKLWQFDLAMEDEQLNNVEHMEVTGKARAKRSGYVSCHGGAKVLRLTLQELIVATAIRRWHGRAGHALCGAPIKTS